MNSCRPADGTYHSAAGVPIRVWSEKMPDSRMGSRQLLLQYGFGGPGQEQFYLDRADQWHRARQIFDWFLRDLNTLGVSFPGTSAAQRDALAKARAARAERRGKAPSVTESIRQSSSTSAGEPTPSPNRSWTVENGDMA